MFARVWTLVTLETICHAGQLFRRSGSTWSCLSSFLMLMSLLYKSWILGGISGAYHLQPHQPKRSRVTSQIKPTWWLGLPNRFVYKWVKYAADLASCIGKALGVALQVIHTDYAKSYIARHWKTGPKGLPAWGGQLPSTGETGEAWVPLAPHAVLTSMNSQNTFSDWFGVSTVELCGRKKRDLGGILRYLRAQK